MSYLDLRGQTSNVAHFHNKKNATAFAKQNGWRNGDVVKAADRFFIWWVVAQQQSTETLTFLKSSGETYEIPHPGYW